MSASRQHDLDGALRPPGRMLAAFGGRATPWLRAVAHSRVGELCLQLGRGEEAGAHLAETLGGAGRAAGAGRGVQRLRVRGAGPRRPAARRRRRGGAVARADAGARVATDGDTVDVRRRRPGRDPARPRRRRRRAAAVAPGRRPDPRRRAPPASPAELPAQRRRPWRCRPRGGRARAARPAGLVPDVAGDLPDMLSRLLRARRRVRRRRPGPRRAAARPRPGRPRPRAPHRRRPRASRRRCG